MSKHFLEYLFGENLITKEQLKEILESEDIKITKNDLFFMYFYNLTIEQIDRINDILHNQPDKPAELIAQELGYVDGGDVSLDYGEEDDYYEQSENSVNDEFEQIKNSETGQSVLYHEDNEYLTEFKYIQKIIDLGLMDLKELYGHLTNYKVDSLLEKNTALSAEENPEKTFICQYLSLALELLNDSFEVKTLSSEFEILNCLQFEAFVYQNIQAEKSFLIGISADIEVLEENAKYFYDKMTAGLDVEKFENTKEASFDLYCEFLNNINSVCTYRFQENFDLGLPGYSENVKIEAGKIYKIRLELNSHNIDFCIIPGAEYNLEYGDGGQWQKY